MADSRTGADIIADRAINEDVGFLSGFSGRQKLKESLNFREFLSNREGEFEIDVSALAASDKLPKKKPKGILENCNFKNIAVEGITDDNVQMMMSPNFEELSTNMENVTPDGGIKKKVDKAGHEGKFPPANAKVWLYYTAICEVWDEPIDKFDRGGKPQVFKIGQGELLPVLELGIPTMELKEVAKFLATPDYAYGKLGLIDRVPPNTTVLFIVELVDFVELGPMNSVLSLSSEERTRANFDDIEKAAFALKMEGNRQWKDENLDTAISKYRKAVKLLDRYVTVQKSIDKKRNELLFVLYINLAQCYLQIEEYEKALNASQLALDLPPGTEGSRSKAYFRQAKAQYELGRFEEAKAVAKEALKLKPGDTDIRFFYEKLCQRVAEDKEVQKVLSKKMIGDMGSLSLK